MNSVSKGFKWSPPEKCIYWITTWTQVLSVTNSNNCFQHLCALGCESYKQEQEKIEKDTLFSHTGTQQVDVFTKKITPNITALFLAQKQTN